MCILINVNNLEWEVVLKEQVEFKKRISSTEDDSYYLGLTIKELDQVWLSDEIQKESLLYRTIKHELTHVFIESYGFGQFSSWSEENLADFIECYADQIVDLSKTIFAKVVKDRCTSEKSVG